MQSDDKFLICTHATFRFAVKELGVEAFDNRMIAIDEFHHVSANPENRLGEYLKQIIERDKTHIVAMTGSYFRGDSDAVLMPEDEAKFNTVTYTYYEQLNGYEYLKTLDIGYYFYNGSYVDSIMKVLDPKERTILHIPNVNSGESTKDKYKEVENIISQLGVLEGIDPDTGFHLVKLPSGDIIKVADLVEDNPKKRSKVLAALKDPKQVDNRDHVHIIIALGMAKEGFDWIRCEHALTVGYRDSLTEIVQIIGRATRDAPGKTRAHFTNLIVEPDATQQNVSEAVNDTLKAISASLLMEQVLAPRFEFKLKISAADDGEDEDDQTPPSTPNGSNSGKGNDTVFIQDVPNGSIVKIKPDHVEVIIKGLRTPKTPEARRICQHDLNDILADFLQNKDSVALGGNESVLPADLTVIAMGKVVRARYPHLDDGDIESIREAAISALNIIQDIKEKNVQIDDNTPFDVSGKLNVNTAFVDSISRYALDVRELNIDMIEAINPFARAYSVLSKSMNEKSFKMIAEQIQARRVKITPEEARIYARRAVEFARVHNRKPDIASSDPWEVQLAKGAIAFIEYKNKGAYEPNRGEKN